MGMFDYIKCDVPLPDGWAPKGPLQTKDFCCEMVTHIITKDGRLMLERIDKTEVVPKAERMYPDAPDDDISSMFGSLRDTRSLHDSQFHGIVNFYSHEGPSFDGKWHEYNAKFTDGQLVSIELVIDEDQPHDSDCAILSTASKQEA